MELDPGIGTPQTGTSAGLAVGPTARTATVTLDRLGYVTRPQVKTSLVAAPASRRYGWQSLKS